MRVNFSQVKICDYNGDMSQRWFIYFSIENLETGEKKNKQIRGKLASFKVLADRRREAAILKVFWEKQLKAGWHPFDEIKANQTGIGLAKRPLPESLQFALENCVVSPSTFKAYRITLKFIHEAMRDLRLTNLQTAEAGRAHFKSILEHCRKSKGWSNEAYNKHLGYLKAILARLVEYEVWQDNPTTKIKTLATAEKAAAYPPLTLEEQIKLQTLERTHPRFYTFLMVLQHTGIRPQEICHLKIQDINLKKRRIEIRPDLQAGNSKTKRIRRVVIDNYLFALLEKHLAGFCNQENYVFGSLYPPQYKGRNKSAEDSSYFAPSPWLVKRDTVTKLWAKMVVKGLGISKKMYSLKHTGAQQMINAGVPLEVVQRQFGHTSKLTTMIYAEEAFNEAFDRLRDLN